MAVMRMVGFVYQRKLTFFDEPIAEQDNLDTAVLTDQYIVALSCQEMAHTSQSRCSQQEH